MKKSPIKKITINVLQNVEEYRKSLHEGTGVEAIQSEKHLDVIGEVDGKFLLCLDVDDKCNLVGYNQIERIVQMDELKDPEDTKNDKLEKMIKEFQTLVANMLPSGFPGIDSDN